MLIHAFIKQTALCTLFTAAVILFTPQAGAQDNTPADSPIKPEVIEKALANIKEDGDINPFIGQIRSQAEGLASILTNKQANDLMILRNAHGMVESIYMVQGNVSEAQNLCSEQYPDMKDFLSDSFEQWEEDVIAKATSQSEILYANINAERFPNPDAVLSYFQTIDKAAEYADAQLVKDPVITQETCRALGRSLQNTNMELVAMLERIQWPADAISPSDTILTTDDVPFTDLDDDPLTDAETYPADEDQLPAAVKQEPADKERMEQDPLPQIEPQAFDETPEPKPETPLAQEKADLKRDIPTDAEPEIQKSEAELEAAREEAIKDAIKADQKDEDFKAMMKQDDSASKEIYDENLKDIIKQDIEEAIEENKRSASEMPARAYSNTSPEQSLEALEKQEMEALQSTTNNITENTEE